MRGSEPDDLTGEELSSKNQSDHRLRDRAVPAIWAGASKNVALLPYPWVRPGVRVFGRRWQARPATGWLAWSIVAGGTATTGSSRAGRPHVTALGYAAR